MGGLRLLLASSGALGFALGCSLSSAYACESDEDCVGGFCESTGSCSFSDTTCASGRRYGEFAGSLSGECVIEDELGDSSGNEPPVTTASGVGSGVDTDSPATDTDDVADEGTTGGEQACPWWDESYGHRQAIQLAELGSTSALVDAPVLVVLNTGRFDYGRARPDGDDLRFVAADDATELAYEVEAWNPNGVSWIWVRLPTIQSSADSFYMYYGNEAATSASDAAGVWTGGYAAVYHLGMPPSDSAGINDAVLHGAVPERGLAGDGYVFDGNNNTHIDAGSDASIDDIFVAGGTITAWIRATDWGEGQYGRIVDKADGVDALRGYAFLLNGHNKEQLEFRRDHTGARGWWSSPEHSILLDAWHFVAVSANDSAGGEPVLYIDGEPVQVVTHRGSNGTPGISEAEYSMWIGERVGGGRTFEGTIDEVRLARTVRSPDWIRLQYKSMSDSLLSFQAIESLDSVCP